VFPYFKKYNIGANHTLATGVSTWLKIQDSKYCVPYKKKAPGLKELKDC
jgi:hypothetical protein